MRQSKAEAVNIVQVERIDDLWAYVLPDDKLVTGSSYGNKKCFANSKATGAIESLFSVDLGGDAIGSTLVRYYDAESGALLEQTGTGDFTIHPAYQKRTFTLAAGLRVSETFYVPNTPQDGLDECAAAYLGLKITNKTADVQRISIVGYSDLRPTVLAAARDVQVRCCYKNAAIIASNQSNEDYTRFFGTTAKNPICSYTADISSVTDNFNITPSLRPSCEQYIGGKVSAERCSVQYVPLAKESAELSSTESSTDARALIGRIQVDVELPPDGEEELTFVIGFSTAGDTDAIRQFELLKNYEKAYEQTLRHFIEETSHSVVTTPDQVINRGVQWAKANMARVKALYAQGWGITNDPGMSSNIVARDTAWFVFGCDYVDPEFSKQALRVFKRLQSADGLIVEYYNGVTGEVDDYELNINDNTPLYILAVAHTFQTTDDRSFLEEMYPSVEKAANYIISQEDERGLVYCTANGVNVYGICGWRNIIPDYTINGAVTEVNAECFAALAATALLADLMGHDDRAAYFQTEAKKLENAVNTHLIDPKSGLYYLNIDTAGNEHPDVTCDLVFPVIWNVATPATSHLIIDRLNRPDFLTTAGVRTVPRTALNYNPVRGWGLLGGVWPDVAFMFAYACSTHQPDVMVNIMRGTFRQFELDPTNQNTVPGQMSEWYHGESLVNNGMKLSPWFPPKYLLTAVEGMCGVSLYQVLTDIKEKMLQESIDETHRHFIEIGRLHINPHIPPSWKWVSLSNMPYHGRAVTYFACRVKGRLNIFANYQFGTSPNNASIELDDDVTDMIHGHLEEIHLVALGSPSHVVICVGNTAASSTSFTFSVSELIETYITAGRYRIRVFHSEIDDWDDQEVRESSNIRGVTVELEVGGFKLIELTAE